MAKALEAALALAAQALFELERQFVLHPTHPLPAVEPLRRAPGESFLDLLHRLRPYSRTAEDEQKLAALPGGCRLEWHPDGQTFLLAGAAEAAGLYDLATGSLLQHRMGVVGTMRQIRWRPAAPRLLTNDDQEVVHVWDWATEADLRFEHAAHAALSPDGAMLLVAHTDGAARLWDAVTGELVHALADHGDAIGALAWRPDGQQVLTGGADGVVRLCDVATGRIFTPWPDTRRRSRRGRGAPMGAPS